MTMATVAVLARLAVIAAVSGGLGWFAYPVLFDLATPGGQIEFVAESDSQAFAHRLRTALAMALLGAVCLLPLVSPPGHGGVYRALAASLGGAVFTTAAGLAVFRYRLATAVPETEPGMVMQFGYSVEVVHLHYLLLLATVIALGARHLFAPLSADRDAEAG